MLLRPNFDKLVDRLLISFQDDGSILLSKDLTTDALESLGIRKASKLRLVRPATLPYCNGTANSSLIGKSGH
jgi:hypothetical protein